MTKQNRFRNELDVLYSEKNKPWIEGLQRLPSSEALFPRDFGQAQVLCSLRESNMEAKQD